MSRPKKSRPEEEPSSIGPDVRPKAKPRARKTAAKVASVPHPVSEKPAPKPRAPRKPRTPSAPKAKPNAKAVAAPPMWSLSPERKRILCLSGGTASILFLVGMYLFYSIDYPYYDQWDFVPFLEKAYARQLTWTDFWAQHNEHRLVFPRLLMLVLARLSHWNIYLELGANFILAGLTWLVLCAQAKAGGRRVFEGTSITIYLMLTLLIFSLSQWQNWFNGWQLQEFMNVLAAVLSFIALTWGGLPGLGIGLAACFGLVATGSFANGILVWPIGLILLILQRAERDKYLRFELLGWFAVGMAVTWAYLRDYATPSYHPPLSSALNQPLQCVLYVLAYLGQPVWNLDPVVSIVMGMIGLLLWSTSLAQLFLSRVSLRVLSPWIGMALYAIGTAAITALGRVDIGLDQAMSSRYVTMANLLWVAVAIQFYWVARLNDGPIVRRTLAVKVVALCALLLTASLTGAYRWAERHHAYSGLRNQVLQGYDLESLHTVYPPNPAAVVERRVILHRLGLTVYRGKGLPLPAGPPP
ncbi:MAG: hypothetical protein JNK74_02335 [Candidatus Hydrogenedentes bacterium]|nr:hypothetical protein [Candidatus Hydrogenedentota bacterium]